VELAAASEAERGEHEAEKRESGRLGDRRGALELKVVEENAFA
jgi:hypothetical protein